MNRPAPQTGWGRREPSCCDTRAEVSYLLSINKRLKAHHGKVH